MQKKNDIMIQLARLWGQREMIVTDGNVALNDFLKSYDPEHLVYLLSEWAEEYSGIGKNVEDICDFFDSKLKILYENGN